MEKLEKEQVECIRFGMQNPAAGIFADPGFGKTRVILELFKVCEEQDVVDVLFVVASRKICKLVWPKENKKWGYDYPVLALNSLSSGKDSTDREDALFNHRGKAIILITYDLIPWFEKFYSRFKKKLNLGRMMLALDESSKFKSTKAERFRSLRRILDIFDRRYILTGTPTPNSLLDLYAQIYLLDGGKRFGTKTNFKNRFFIPCGYMGYDSRPIENAEEKIYDVIKDIVVRYDSSHLNLPSMKLVDVDIELDEKTMQLHQQIKKEMFAEIDGELVDAPHAGVVVNKLRQIVGGAIYIDEQGNFLDEDTAKKKKLRKYKTIHDDKIGILQELIEEMQGKPCLIAYEFNHEKERLKKVFPKASFMESGCSDKKAAKMEQDWNDGKIDLLFGHPQSIGHGLNLQGVNAAIIFYSINYNYDNYYQFIKRVWRQGQEGTVFVYRLIGVSTVDDKIVLNLAKKQKTQKDFLNTFKQTGDIEMTEAKSAFNKPTSSKKTATPKKKAAPKKKTVAREAPHPKKKVAPASKKKADLKKKSAAKRKAAAPKKKATAKAPATRSSKFSKLVKTSMEVKPGTARHAVTKHVPKNGIAYETLLTKVTSEFGGDAKKAVGYISGSVRKGFLKEA